MYHFKSEIDWSLFFRFDRKWIEDENWARISPAAKSIFPVIARHCNEGGDAYPGQEAIAALSGRTSKTIRAGIRALEGFPGFACDPYTTKRGVRAIRYRLQLPDKRERGRTFFFKHVIIDGGIWRELKPAAQALYPVMRYFGRYDYWEDENEVDDFDERYANREWELCNADNGQLAKHAGIDRHTVADAMKSLKENFLIEPHVDGNGQKAWKVFIKPAYTWKASYLNKR
jgi:hypothetical protein